MVDNIWLIVFCIIITIDRLLITYGEVDGVFVGVAEGRALDVAVSVVRYVLSLSSKHPTEEQTAR
jgi:hypothetical protein